MQDLINQNTSYGRFFIEEINSDEDEKDLFDFLIHKKPKLPITTRKGFTYEEIPFGNERYPNFRLDVMDIKSGNFDDFNKIWNHFSIQNQNIHFNYPDLSQDTLDINSIHSDHRDDFRSHLEKVRKIKVPNFEDRKKFQSSTNLDTTHVNSNSECNFKNKQEELTVESGMQTVSNFQIETQSALLIENNVNIAIFGKDKTKNPKTRKSGRCCGKKILKRKKVKFEEKNEAFTSLISPIQVASPINLKMKKDGVKIPSFFDFIYQKNLNEDKQKFFGFNKKQGH